MAGFLPKSIQALPAVFPRGKKKHNIVLQPTADKIYKNLFTSSPPAESSEQSEIDLTVVDPVSLSTLINGRPTDTALIVLAGCSGAGKSSLINAIFEDSDLCKTNEFRSETSDPVLISKQIKADCKDFSVQGNLAFVDVPGYGDTEEGRDANNLAKIKGFLKNSSMLAPRTKLNQILPEASANVFPNMILFVINGKDNRILGKNADLSKSLKLLLEAKNLLDVNKPNLVIVVTHACSIGIREAKFKKNWAIFKDVVKQAVSNVLGDMPVEILPVENQGDDEDYELEKTNEGYYKLPDGSLSHYNVIQAILQQFTKNQDETGKLFVSAYLNPKCIERSMKAKVTPYVATPSAADIREADLAVQKLERDMQKITPVYQFQSLGYGYDPVTEEIKPSNLLKLSSANATYPLQEVNISDSKFMIPNCIRPYLQSITSFHQMSFVSKHEYEKHKANSYGIGANIKLVVDVAAESKWILEDQNKLKTDKFSLCYALQVAKFTLEDIKDHINNAEFKETLESLPSEFSETTSEIFAKFFEDWGTHIIYEHGIGGFVQFDARVADVTMRQTSATTLSASLNAAYKILSSIGANFNAAQKLQELKNAGVSGVLLRFEGGQTQEYLQFESITEDILKAWSKSVTQRPTELRGSIKLFPYHSLLEYGNKYLALKKATEDYLEGRFVKKRQTEVSVETPVMSREGISQENTSEVEFVSVFEHMRWFYFTYLPRRMQAIFRKKIM